MKTHLALAALFLVGGCDPAEITKIEQSAVADFQTGCAGWNLVATVTGAGGALLPPPFDAIAAATIAFVGDACTDPAFAASAGADQVAWINRSADNLRAVVAQAEAGKLQPSLAPELARLPSYGELQR